MCKRMVKEILDIAKISNSSKIDIVTNHLKIHGHLYIDSLTKKNETLISLTNVKIWRLEDACKSPEGCSCEDSSFCQLDWLHVNVGRIAAFSIIK